MTTTRPAIPSDGHAIIKKLIGNCTHVLDLGCGERHHTKHLPNTVWVDIDPKHATDPRVLVMDIREVPDAFKRMRFDAALLTDVIEHLPKQDGFELITKLEALCDRIIVFTPLGPLWEDLTDPSPHAHRSGWYPKDLPEYEHWVWQKFHTLKTGYHGAFFAWKWIGQPTPEAVVVASELRLKNT